MKLPTPIGRQKEVLCLPASGHFVVLGTAGSGKTTLAILRSAYLGDPQTDHHGKTLLVTFNRALVAYLKYLQNRRLIKESAVFVNLGGVIALVPVDHEQGLAQKLKEVTLNANAIIYIETRSLKSVYENVQRVGALVLDQIDYGHGRRSFRCLDPDGNVVELTEAVGST